jgi:hypothetical protein
MVDNSSLERRHPVRESGVRYETTSLRLLIIVEYERQIASLWWTNFAFDIFRGNLYRQI